MAKEVKIFTTPSCVYCRMTKEFFKKNNIPYEEYNVAQDGKAREEMVQKSGQLACRSRWWTEKSWWALTRNGFPNSWG